MGTFADGLLAMSKKGIFSPCIRLTRKRAWILRDMIKILEDSIPEEGDPVFKDYCATLEWMRQQVKKRYSEFDLGKL